MHLLLCIAYVLFQPSSNIQHSQYPTVTHSESQSYYDHEGSSSYVEEPPQEVYEQNRPLTPGQRQGSGSLPPQPLYQAPYESSGSLHSGHHSTGKSHGRYSLPTSSSGFVPIPTPTPSVFVAPHVTGYLPPQPTPAPAPFPAQPSYGQLPPPVEPAAAPAPHGYGPGYGSGYVPPRSPVPPSYAPPRSPIPPSNVSPPVGVAPPVTASTTLAIAQSQSYPVIPPSSSYYQQYAQAAYSVNPRPYVSTAAPSVQHAPETSQSHPLPVPPVNAPVPPQGSPDAGGYVYQHHQAPTPYSQVPPPPPTLSHSTSSPLHTHVSRPLPQPTPRVRRHSMVTGTASQISLNGTQPGGYDGYSYAHIPPPPPLPTNAVHPGGTHTPYRPVASGHVSAISVPPPPPLSSAASQSHLPSATRHHSLNGYSGSHPLPPPPPATQHMQQSTVQIPPPPPPPVHSQGYYQAPAPVDTRAQHPGPLPRPPQIAPPTDVVHHSPVAASQWQ